MLRSLFGSNRPLVLVFLLVPAVLAGVLALIYSGPTPPELAGPAYDLLFKPVHRWPAFSVGLGLATIMAGAILVNQIFNVHEYAQRENYLPAFTYFMMGCSSLEWVYFNPVFLANVLLLLSLRRFLRIYRTANATSMLYDSGLFLALSAVVYPPMIWVAPFVWVAMYQLRSASLREALVPIVGMATPAVYLVAAYWWFDVAPDLTEFITWKSHFDIGPDADAGPMFLWFGAITLSIGAFGLSLFASGMGSSTVHRKNSKRVFLWLSFFLVALFVYTGFLQKSDAGITAVLCIPVSVFLAMAFAYDQRKWVADLIFYSWLFLALLRMLQPALW